MSLRTRISGCPRTAGAVALLLIAAAAFPQDLPRSSRGELRVDPSRLRDSAVITLPHRLLLPGTDAVVIEGGRVLIRNLDYTITPAAGRIEVRRDLLDSLLAGDGPPPSLTVSYRFFPFRLGGTYARRTVTMLADSAAGDTIRRAPSRPSLALDDVFGRTIRKSGSLTRGFTVGSNRDLSLTSGFRMELAGTLGSDVEVAASLTDENTPIQPEGTTQTLQEFDKVFVEIRSGAYAATLGDFLLELGGTEFGRLTRKLQGAQGTADFRGESTGGTAALAGAVTRGKYATNRFQGAEGVQGPYRLTAPSGDPAIIVIAGTEKVYHNGERQTRGEMSDYVIDYSTGEIRFTARRLITAASRIVVDFEYADRRFVRSLAAAQGTASFIDDRVKLSAAYIREADDPEAPIDVVLDDSARAILAGASADPGLAVVSGVTRVDSNGLYLRVDTLLAGGEPRIFYRYAPGAPGALYVVTFSFVGTGRGEYVRVRPGEFIWKGPGGGDSMPVVLLPFAQSQQILDVTATASPIAGLRLGGEFARSEVDRNRFSSLDPLFGGHALRFHADLAVRGMHVGSLALGDVDVSVRERFVDGRFTPIDRTNPVEFERSWGIEGSPGGDEELREASLVSRPFTGLSLGTGYGRITRGDLFRSVRNDAALNLSAEGLPAIAYTVESIRSSDAGLAQRGFWLRQKGSASYAAGTVVPSVRFDAEDRFLRPSGGADLQSGSFRHRVYAPGIAFGPGGPFSISGELEWRVDDRAVGGTMARDARSFTQAYAARLTEWNHLASSLELTLRKRTSAVPGGDAVRTFLIRNQTRYAPWDGGLDADLFYQVVTERSARLVRVFTRVTRGTGTHRYRGDLNGNGVADEEEYEPVRFDGEFVALTLASDDQVPVIDLKTGLRLRVRPERISRGGWTGVLSSETYVRLEEKSTDRAPERIALLDLSRFRMDPTTITGSALLTQDLHFFEGSPRFSGRLRFSERSGMAQFAGGAERSLSSERSVRLLGQLIPEISAQADLANRRDRVAAPLSSSRTRDVTANTLALDVTYRPEERVEVGMRLEVGRSADRSRTPEPVADLNTQAVRLVYALPGAGQARAEVAREEILLDRGADDLPFELTGGRGVGAAWLWKCSLEYRLTDFLQASAQYDGRSEGRRSAAVHTARGEVRAFF